MLIASGLAAFASVLDIHAVLVGGYDILATLLSGLVELAEQLAYLIG